MKCKYQLYGAISKLFKPLGKAEKEFLKRVEKYEKTIYFIVDKDQCHMEAVEPRTVQIMPMGYEARKEKKSKKEVEELAEQIGITREAVQRAKEKNILKEEDMVKPQDKLVPTPSKQAKVKQSKSAPNSGVQKSAPPRKPQSTSTDGIEKRKKEKYTRKYVATKEETESDEEVREVKKTTTFARVVRKTVSGDASFAKKLKTQGEQSSRTRIDLVEREIVDDTTDNQAVGNSDEPTQDPPKIEIIVEIIATELSEAGKGEGDGEKGEEVVKTKKAVKEKGEEKTNEALVIMTKAIIPDKGKQIAVDEDDFSHGSVELSTLSPLQALKLATLVQIKASEDLLKSTFEEK
ncbi:uncharacterized protein LOC131860187 [Cryptomeria japonica]|uniref:uncharacterized protein LOC131860187 n=1 Tax=Cryptomeria japonica TaxID=3369 RepID=UPI0027D9EB81|nr:uncharacterized protein LOC131860187 [Cryptomeria japonica]